MNSASRRRLLTRLLIRLPTAALAGATCLGAAGPAPRRELAFWTMQLAPFHNDYVQGLIARFEAARPGVRVKWTDVPWAEA
ncbi:MAG: hypothetical protein ACOVN7_13225, partial [Rubrivivax sp.]